MGFVIMLAGSIFGIDALLHHPHDFWRYVVAGGFVLAGLLVRVLNDE